MINSNLPQHVITKELGDYIDRVNFILSELDSEIVNIVNNRKLLGKLHHALNISNYKQPEFRELLLEHAGKEKLESFLKKIKIIDAPITTYANLDKLVKQAAHTPWANNESTKAFVSTFGYEENLIPNESVHVPPSESCASYGDPLKTLKDYQSAIFFKCMHEIENPWNRLIIKMPTGAGKTRTCMEIVSHFLRDDNNKKFEQIVWIADRDELCEQAISSIKHVWPHVGNKSLNIYRLWGSRRHDKFKKPAFIVATYQTLYSLLKQNVIFPEPHLVVTDEAHNILAPTHKKVLDKLLKQKTRVIGLTATPIRSDDAGKKNLIEYFNGNIVGIDSGDESAIRFLQGRGYLARCIPKSIKSDREYRLSSEQRKEIERDGDLPPGFLDKIARDDKRNIIITEKLLQLQEEGKQVLYFAPSVEQSKFMCMILLTKGANAAHVDGNTPMEYRRDVITKFKEKKLNFIFNFDVFATGFDAPNIDAVFIARPTKSLVLHQQMIGRGMRGRRMGGTDKFILYRIVDNMPEIDLADDYFTDIWKYYE